MSPTRRPSSVASLRRAMAAPPAAENPSAESLTSRPAAASAGSRSRPVRITLNLPVDLYREMARWMDSAAEAVDAPRLSVQDTLRAMIRAGINDTAAGGAVLAELRQRARD
jgi:hypothetical protein